ncbi:MAG TPA: hypothetical protein VFK33_00445 [Bacillales bacterium]|nr:hypothetical protein [Bacillales bacterium]
MNPQECYSNLAKQFEQGLNRPLQTDEKEMIRWMAEQAAREPSIEKQLAGV